MDVEAELHREIGELRGNHPKLQPDELFVHWFLRAYLTEDDDSAGKALVGGPRDGGIDAILIDDEVRKVFLVQGKYRQSLGGASEPRTSLLSFAKLASLFWAAPSEQLKFIEALDPLVQRRLQEGFERVRKRNYGLQMYYATTGRCPEGRMREAEEVAY
jgi:hypothetical protein